MAFNFFKKSPDDAPVHAVYQSIVAQSRQERFYADWGVPDTVTGRFDMISLHMALFMRRIQKDDAGRAFSQRLVDAFFLDMDRSLREMGVTDLGVPKKVRNMGNLFYGLATALGTAIDSGNRSEIEGVLIRNVYGDAPSAGAGPLAEHLVQQAEVLAAQPIAALIAPDLKAGAAA